jgi:catechol 2,3-dioxygenase-like lactoylglutathione lyase family enzyme
MRPVDEVFRKNLGTLAVLALLVITDRGSGAATSPSHVRPFLAAISVGDLAVSRKWYADMLGFRSLEGWDFTSPEMSVAFLELNGFRLELIERRGSFAARDGLTFAGEPLVRGIKKLAFVVDDLDAFAAQARGQHARVLIGIRPSREPGLRSMILADPDGNWIQLYDRRAPVAYVHDRSDR